MAFRTNKQVIFSYAFHKSTHEHKVYELPNAKGKCNILASQWLCPKVRQSFPEWNSISILKNGRKSMMSSNGIRRNLFNEVSSPHRKACILNEMSRLGGGWDIMPGLKGEQNLDGFFVNLFPGNLNIGTSSRICHLNTEVVPYPIVVLVPSWGSLGAYGP